MGAVLGLPSLSAAPHTDTLNPQGSVESSHLFFQPCRPQEGGGQEGRSHLLTLLQPPVVRDVRTAGLWAGFLGTPKYGWVGFLELGIPLRHSGDTQVPWRPVLSRVWGVGWQNLWDGHSRTLRDRGSKFH